MDSVRNPDGIWINTLVFREEALRFQKYGAYCPDPWGSPDWFDYWQTQRERCIYGYTVGGVRITGDHYFYLNFCPIMKVEDTNLKKSVKINSKLEHANSVQGLLFSFDKSIFERMPTKEILHIVGFFIC